MTRRHVMLLLRLGCGGGLLWWALQRAEFSSISTLKLSDIHIGWLLLAIAFGGLSVLGWAVRWRTFVQINNIKMSLAESLRLTLFADFFNFYFLGPLGGDGVRALFLHKKNPNRKMAIAHSILMDHAVGLVSGAILYALFTRPQSEWITSNSSIVPSLALHATDIFLGVMGVLTLSALLAICTPPLWNHLDSKPFIRWIIHPLRPFLFLRPHRNAIIGAHFVSILSLISGYLAYFFAGHAVGHAVPLMNILTIMPMVDAISALPITISGLGVRENLFVELLGGSMAGGASAAVIVSLAGFAVTGVWGLIGGIWLGLYRMRRKSQEPADLSSSISETSATPPSSSSNPTPT